MTVYKLTDQKMHTRNGYQWALGEWRETSGDGELCGSGWLHAYEDPLLAVLLNPIHASIANPRLFEAEADSDGNDDRGIKCGFTRLRLTKELPLPIRHGAPTAGGGREWLAATVAPNAGRPRQ